MRLGFEPPLLRKGAPPCFKLEKMREVEKVKSNLEYQSLFFYFIENLQKPNCIKCS